MYTSRLVFNIVYDVANSTQSYFPYHILITATIQRVLLPEAIRDRKIISIKSIINSIILFALIYEFALFYASTPQMQSHYRQSNDGGHLVVEVEEEVKH